MALKCVFLYWNTVLDDFFLICSFFFGGGAGGGGGYEVTMQGGRVVS